MEKRVTLNDLAKYCHLSQSMVAQVIRNPEGVKATERTKKKVFDAVKALDYRPNLAAKSLRTRKSNQIGVLVPSISSFYNELVMNIDKALKKYNYNGVYSYWELEPDPQQEFLAAFERIKRLNVDGIISCQYDISLAQESLPLVYYGNERDDLDCVFPDKIAYARQAVQYLYAQGHRKIGCIGILHEIRYQQIYKCLEQLNLPINPLWQIDSYGIMECGYRDMNKLLSHSELPTAIIIHSDLMMLGVLRSAQEHHVRIPEDISVLSFDNLKEAPYFFPPLTTFDQCYSQAAEHLVTTVLKRIAEPHRPLEKIAITMPLIERKSVRNLLTER